jgi:hypothetical protein
MSREQFHAMGTTITLLLPERKVEIGSKLVRGLFMEWELTAEKPGNCWPPNSEPMPTFCDAIVRLSPVFESRM